MHTLSYGAALNLLKQGNKVAEESWEGRWLQRDSATGLLWIVEQGQGNQKRLPFNPPVGGLPGNWEVVQS